MALSFPQNPVDGQIYSQYVYSSTLGIWRNQNDPTTVGAAVATKAPIASPTFTGTVNPSSTLTIGGTMNTAAINSGTITSTGNINPQATNSYDLGTAALRWRNIYTQDLNLSNGIGDYTIIEGIEELYLVNNNSGKHFKFALIEVDPSEVPPKSES